MHYVKIFFMAIIAFNINPLIPSQVAYTQEDPTELIENNASTLPEETTDSNSTTIAADEASQIPLDKWKNHLSTLTAEKGKLWNASYNVPDYSWTSQATKLAQDALDADQTVADTLKSDFRTILKEKITQENGDATADGYINLIIEFEKTIQKKLDELAEQNKVIEEIKNVVIEEAQKEEPVTLPLIENVEQTTVLPVTEETQSSSSPSTPDNNDSSKSLFDQWDDLMETIAKEGKTFNETQSLLDQAFNLAIKTIPTMENPELLPRELQDAMREHNTKQDLYPMSIQHALALFSEKTNIEWPKQSQEQFSQPGQPRIAAVEEMRQQSVQQEKAKKEAGLKVIASLQKANRPEGETEKINKALQEKFAAMERQHQNELTVQIAQLRSDLIAAKKQPTPAPSQGLFGTAIGAVKNAASAASRWWYGTEEDDQKRLETLKNLLTTLGLDEDEKKLIEDNWNTFINNVHTAPDLSDTSNMQENKNWIIKLNKTLGVLVTQYHIISFEGACDIVDNMLNSSENSELIIKEINKYKENEKRKVSQAKEQREADLLKQTQKKEKKEAKILRKEKATQDEKNRIAEEKKQHELLKINYQNAQQDWKKLLGDISHHQHTTDEDNIKFTNEAIRISKAILQFAGMIPTENPQQIAQNLKSDFSIALLEQKKSNESSLNIFKYMKLFNAEINKLA